MADSSVRGWPGFVPVTARPLRRSLCIWTDTPATLGTRPPLCKGRIPRGFYGELNEIKTHLSQKTANPTRTDNLSLISGDTEFQQMTCPSIGQRAGLRD